MPSSYSPRFGFELPATNELPGIWGVTVNTSITSLIEEATQSVSVITNPNADQALTIPNGVSSPNRAGWIVIDGALTANRTVTLPAGNRTLVVENATSGGFNVLFKGTTSGTVTVAPGMAMLVRIVGSTITALSPAVPNLTATTATIGTLSAGFSDGAVGTPSIGFSSDTDTGIYRIGANQIGFSTGGAQRLSISTGSVTSSLNLNISKSNPEIAIDPPSVSERLFAFKTNGSARWAIRCRNVAESGGNTGSPLSLARHDDTGALLGWGFTVNRDTGHWIFNGLAPLADTTVRIVTKTDVASERALNLVNANDDPLASVGIDFNSGGGGGTRASIDGGRSAFSTLSGRLVFSTYFGSTKNAVLTLERDQSAAFTGAVTAISFTPTSDRRLKTDIERIGSSLDRIEQIIGCTFTMFGKRKAGVLAQDVAAVLPEAQSETTIPLPGGGNALGVDPMAVIGLLVEGIKELRAEVRKLKEAGNA
jgi:hypothetical protein